MGLLPAIPSLSHSDATLNFQRIQREFGAAWKLASLLGFEHSWKAYEAGLRLPEYRKVFDIVEMRGIIKGGESSKSAFILPVGYRPKEEKAFLVNASGSTGFVFVSAGAFGVGTVVPQNLGGEVKTFTYLDQVRFSVS